MIFSGHFKNSLKAIGAAVILLLVGYSCVRRKADQQERSIPLKPDVAEEVSFDQHRHQVTVTTPSGTTTQYSRGGKVDILKNGKVVVRADRFGLERVPFAGVGYGDGAVRLQLGVSFAYVWWLDLNAHLAIAMHGEPRTVALPLSVSYNFFGNIGAFVGADPLPLFVGLPASPHLGLLVRFW